MSVAEEQLITYLRKAVEDIKNLDKMSIEEAAREYEEATSEKERTSCLHIICTKFEDLLTNHPSILAPHVAKIFASIFLLGKSEIKCVSVGNSIVISCRCKTTDGLLDLDKLVASDELDELFSLVMSCLINQPAAACVSISEEEFKRCLKSLNDDAG